MMASAGSRAPSRTSAPRSSGSPTRSSRSCAAGSAGRSPRRSSPGSTPQQGTDWASSWRLGPRPSEPSAWDMPTVAGAAFARYAREASDYRGPRPPSPRAGARLDPPQPAAPTRLVCPPRPSLAGAADHDLVLLDRDLDRPVAGPVLGVDRVVLDGGVEPQAVALVAMVEGGLERAGGLARARGRRPPRRPRRRGAGFSSPSSSLSSSSVDASGCLGLAGPRPPRARRRSARRPRPGDRSRRRSRRPRPTASPSVAAAEAVLAPERLDLLNRHLELVSDPRVGSPLANPGANPVELRPKRSASHTRGD